MNNLEKISHEAMVFMRGNYRLDEIGDGKDELKFKQGTKTIIHTEVYYADEITWGILPYVPYQYEK